MDADTIIANLIEKHTPKKDSSHIIKFSSNNKKLIGAKDTAKTKKIKKK
jgi:hypothetical protein